MLAAVDEAAALAGLAPGLPLADARALLPGLETAGHAPDEDRRALLRLAEWCGRYTPWSAPDPACGDAGGGAGLLLDVTGCAHLFGGEAALLAELTGRLERFGFAARAALAETVGAAWAVARFATDPAHPWRVVAPGEARAALNPLPPAALRLPPAALELLERLGLRSVGALADLPAETLVPRLGPEPARRLRQALDAAPEALSPLAPVPPQLARRIFAEPILTAEDIARALDGLTASLCRSLEAAQQGARRLDLTLYRVDGGLQRLTLGTSRPSRDPAHLSRLFAGRIEGIDPGFGIEVMTLAATGSEPLTARQIALEPGTDARGTGDLAGLVDRLGARFGLARVFALAPVESHLPERAQRPVPALESAAGAAWHDGRPRPILLFARPEAVEVVALLPDHPPARFRWRRILHRVARAEGPERIAPEWWRDGEAGTEEPARDYFRVEDEEGRRFWLYRAGQHWFLHGLFG